jgi:hypothetical protein
VADQTTEFFVWREYPVKPYQRYAFTVVEDLTADDGYRITHHDAKVADLGFTHRFHDHMMRPHPVTRGVYDNGIDGGATTIAHAKEPGHFREAVRTYAGSATRPWRAEP